METQLPTPDSSPEMNPNFQPEQSLDRQVVPTPEKPVISPETKGSEQAVASQGGGDPAWQAPQLPTIPINDQAPVPVVSSQTTPVSDTPLTANDEDLIEQEWVQKAKKIVASTRDDPYMQEREVSKLQADYMQKRYGKEVKLTGE